MIPEPFQQSLPANSAGKLSTSRYSPRKLRRQFARDFVANAIETIQCLSDYIPTQTLAHARVSLQVGNRSLLENMVGSPQAG